MDIKNNLSSNVGAIDLKENIINSILDFDDALESKSVAEVSDDLIGVFYNQDDAFIQLILKCVGILK